jgi:hypothetical protein
MKYKNIYGRNETFSPSDFEDYFITIKEIRKRKIKKIMKNECEKLI